MKIGFAILTWNRHQFLERCLKGLVASIENPANCKIVVMDNGSTDGTDRVLQQYESNPLVKIQRLKKNYGLSAYKKLFNQMDADYIVVVDDDVLEFPSGIDRIYMDYMQTFPDYGYLSLNVVQNEFTDGAKPGPEKYSEEERDGRVVEKGPAGGWCACFRRSEYRKIRWKLMLMPLSMKRPEDAVLTVALQRYLHLKVGIIRDAVCFHASGPYYARQFGHLDREIEKYSKSGLDDFVKSYEAYRE